MMQNFTLVMVNDSVSKNDIETFFGDNLLSINQMTNYDSEFEETSSNEAYPMLSGWGECNLEESPVKSKLMDFMTYFSPKIEKYSERSFLLRSSKSLSSFPGYEVVESDELISPLYYNKSLGGWITSSKNESVLFPDPSPGSKKKTVSSIRVSNKCPRPTKTASKKTASSSNYGSGIRRSTRGSKSTTTTSKKVTRKTSARLSKTKSVGELTGYKFSTYKNGLLLKYSKVKSNGEKYFHGGYWNQSLSGWIFSSKHESTLVSLGAKQQ